MGKKRFVLSAGTGRCGTTSIQKLLNLQPGARILKEAMPLPFQIDTARMEAYIDRLSRIDAPVVGDSAFYITPYASLLIERLQDDVRIIYPHRPCREQVESNFRFWHDRNQVTDPAFAKAMGLDLGATNRFYDAHPKFPCGMRKALEIRCLAFHSIAEECERLYPDHFKVVPFRQVLTDADQQADMLRFLGFKNPVVHTRIWENKLNPKAGRHD